MDKSEVIKLANRFALKVKSNYDCIDVILFGSYVKGTNHKESDIDIAVVLKDYDSTINIQLELMRLRREIDSRIEPHPFRLVDFDNTNPLVDEIIRYGQKVGNATIV